MILVTGSYNVEGPDGEMVAENVPGLVQGPDYTQAAIDASFPGLGSAFIAVAMFFFAFTTLPAFAFYADPNLPSRLGSTPRERLGVSLARVVRAGSISLASLRSAAFAWSLADVGLGLYTWVNLIALVLLSKQANAVVRDYDRQRKAGLDPVF